MNAKMQNLIYNNKHQERKEIVEAIIGVVAIFAFVYLWFAIL